MTRLSGDRPITGLSDHRTIRNHVKSLSLTHFRNYHNARIETDGLPVVLTGPNGAGKTNVLEAISLLSPGRGLRRATLGDMDNMSDHAPWVVSCEAFGAQGEVNIGTGHDPDDEGAGDKRIVRIDGKTLRGQAELTRVFSVLWLTPQMDNLFLEGGTARRRFLDRLVYSFEPEHASHVNAYEQAMRERNRLLSEGKTDPLWLAALEQKMAEQGIAIAVARQHAAERLDNALLQAKGSFPKAVITLSGAVEAALVQGSALAAEDAFRGMLASARLQDAQAGRCSVGTHRTAVEVMHLEKNLPAERCSTGEQKALLVSIILAQATAGAMWHANVPVLLLDEVATHLDATRRRELFEALSDTGAQCWLTSTDREIFSGFDARFLGVEDGNIRALGAKENI
jgi:DNA replication and repair protein RecF